MRIKASSAKRVVCWVGFGGLLLFLFHFEPVNIGPFKFSHLWKGALLVLLFACARIKPSVYNSLFLLSVLTIFSSEIFRNPMNAVLTFSTTVLIPLIGLYALRKNPRWSKEVLFFFSAFFILCFVPYELGLLSPLGEGYDLSGAYGFNVQGSIGPFQTVHGASTALAGALLVILYFQLTATYSSRLLVPLLLLGFYFLFNTYVRTGMAMFAVGALVLLGSFAIRSHRTFMRVVLLVSAIVPVVAAGMLSNEALMARILGERVHNSELGSFEAMGSGRGALAVAALEIYGEATVSEKMFGMGVTKQKERMAEKLGNELIPHNGFLAILVHFGLTGFLVFMWFLVNLWRRIGRLRSPAHVIFLRALVAGYIVMTFFQQFDMLYMTLLLMLAYAWLHNSEKYELLKKVGANQM